MHDITSLGWKLLAIAAVAGLALGLTNAVTKGPIAEQQVAEATAARQAVLPEADTFTIYADENATVDEAYVGYDAAGATVGMTAKITANGYGGEIEVTVGLALDGTITGVNVGGANFSETAGLGARTKEPAFREQFAGQSWPVALTKDGGQIDAVTSATISSTAVTNAVNDACAYLAGVLETEVG